MLFSIAVLAAVAFATPVDKRQQQQATNYTVPAFRSMNDGQIVADGTAAGLRQLYLQLNSGRVIDQARRTCYTVASTGQLQCSSPVITQPVNQAGFTNQNGFLAQNGNAQFYKCQTIPGQNRDFLVYNRNDPAKRCMPTMLSLRLPSAAQRSSSMASRASSRSSSRAATSTVRLQTTITRTASRTASSARASSTRASSTRTSATTTSMKASSTAAVRATPVPVAAVAVAQPAVPSGKYFYPRLIVPTIQGKGPQDTSYFVVANQTTQSQLLFDIPYNTAYKQCTIVGFFPVGGSDTSTFSGSAEITVSLLASNIVLKQTSAANVPTIARNLGTKHSGEVAKGQAAVYDAIQVKAGTSISFSVVAKTGSLSLFEDYNPPIVGYVLICA